MKTKIDGTNVIVMRSAYCDNNTLAIFLDDLDDEEPYADITVNLQSSEYMCDERTAFVDTNNCPWAEQFLKENGLGTPTGYYASNGYCEYPLYIFNIEKMEEA